MSGGSARRVRARSPATGSAAGVTPASTGRGSPMASADWEADSLRGGSEHAGSARDQSGSSPGFAVVRRREAGSESPVPALAGARKEAGSVRGHSESPAPASQRSRSADSCAEAGSARWCVGSPMPELADSQRSQTGASAREVETGSAREVDEVEDGSAGEVEAGSAKELGAGSRREDGSRRDARAADVTSADAQSPLSPKGRRLRQLHRASFRVGERYTVRCPLSYGRHGLVWAADDRESVHSGSERDEASPRLRPGNVAIKKITDPFRRQGAAKRALREVSILRALRHPNVLSLRDVMLRREDGVDHLYLVSPLMDVDLHTLIHSNQDITTQHVTLFMYQALCGVNYMHSAGVLHRDLKPANLLLTLSCRLRVADFGHARLSPDPDSHNLTEYVVTRFYRAPEVVLEVRRGYDGAVDVWSLGCVLAELLLREPLFPGTSYADQLVRIVQVCGTPSADDVAEIDNPDSRAFMRELKPRAPVPMRKLFPEASRRVLALLEGMLQFNPRQRWNVKQALAQPLFRGLRRPRREQDAPAQVEFDYDPERMAPEQCREVLLREIASMRPAQQPEYDHCRARNRLHGIPDPIAGFAAAAAAARAGP
eukprot:TRINITY_DN39473_c0_g1_i1.p1 TRINITY_DN39473_c0_g1~~TRINITY_DN39473_c0_g1_i1.p1  ORF type:complete len:617 (+),score=141.60 TRINITY_DN39473_c0_g1_i1:49-1851(+)